MAELVIPSSALSAQLAAFRRAFVLRSEFINGGGGLAQFECIEDWLDSVARNSDPSTVAEGRVASRVYCYVDNDVMVGLIALRPVLNEYLSKYGGHIAYCVHPEHRRRGHATQMLRMCLEKAREAGSDRVLITCEEDNEASRKIILANGGEYESTVFEPDERVNIERYWIEL